MNESQATAAETAPPDIEWSARPTDDGDHKTPWPDLRPAARCDGENPTLLVESAAGDGVEWMRTSDNPHSRNELGWPELRSAPPDPCEGRNPTTNRACQLGYHQGYHRDDTDAEWLDD